MSILDRYLSAEIIKPFAMILGLLLIVFLGFTSSVQLRQAADGVIQGGVALQLSLLNTLVSMEILLPTTLYLAIITGLSRMYRDSEMVVMAASGVSGARVAWSVAKLALLIAVCAGFLSMVGRPWAYRLSYELEHRAITNFDVKQMEAGQFIELRDSGYVLFAGDVDADSGRLRQVFLQRPLSTGAEVIWAEEAQVPPPTLVERLSVKFDNGYVYRTDPGGRSDVTLNFGHMRVFLPEDNERTTFRRKAESTHKLAQSSEPKDIAEYQWRVSTPLATVLLALLAVPLSRSNPRQTRFGSYVTAIFAYALVLGITSVVRTWVEQGKVAPMPGLWVAYVFPAAFLVLLPLKTRLAFVLRKR